MPGPQRAGEEKLPMRDVSVIRGVKVQRGVEKGPCPWRGLVVENTQRALGMTSPPSMLPCSSPVWGQTAAKLRNGLRDRVQKALASDLGEPGSNYVSR